MKKGVNDSFQQIRVLLRSIYYITKLCDLYILNSRTPRETKLQICVWKLEVISIDRDIECNESKWWFPFELFRSSGILAAIRYAPRVCKRTAAYAIRSALHETYH